MRETGARQVERPLGIQDVGVYWRDGPAGLAEQDHHAPALQTIQTLVESFAAHRIVHHMDALPLGQLFDLGLKVGLLVQNDVIGSGLARSGCLFLGGNRADDPGPNHFGHLDQKQTGSTGRCVDERCLAAAQRERRMRKVVSRHPLQHHGGGSLEIHLVWKLYE